MKRTHNTLVSGALALLSGSLPSACGSDGGPTSCTPGGALDSAFGSDGVVVVSDPAPPLDPVAAANQPFSRFVVAANAFMPNRIALARFSGDGALDSSFGSAGISILMVGSGSESLAMASASDDSIVVAGVVDNAPAVVHLNPDGSLDTAFGTSGMVGINGAPFGVSVSDTAITVAYGVLAAPNDPRFALARRLLNGNPDPTFGTNGDVVDDITITSCRYAVDPQGRPLVVGLGGVGNQELELARYLDTGVRDSTFGAAGATHVPLPGLVNPEVVGLAIAANGRIVVGLNDGANGVGIVALTKDGMLDTTYGTDGSTWFQTNVGANALVETPYDAIVLAGPDFSGSRLFAVRFTASGAVDTCFDGDGLVRGPMGMNASAVVQDTGALVLVGSEQIDPVQTRIVLARYTP